MHLDRVETDPVALLISLAAAGDAAYAASAIGGLDNPAVSQLVRGRLLSSEGVRGAIVCDACDHPHPAQVHFDADRQDYGWLCPNVGFVILAQDDAAALCFQTETLARKLRGALEAAFGQARGPCRRLEDADAWALGSYQIGSGWAAIVAAGSLGRTEATVTLANALARYPRQDAGILLTYHEAAIAALPHPFRQALLSRLLLLGEDGSLRLDVDFLLTVARDAQHATGPGRGGRPSTKAKVWQILDAFQADAVPIDRPFPADVKKAWLTRFPSEAPPSRSVIREHVRTWLIERPVTGTSRST